MNWLSVDRIRRGLSLAALWLACCSALPLDASPIINEFLAANNGGLKDEDGDTPDWIELHNPDAIAVNLANWALTDTATNLTKWRLPATNLPAGGYLVVFASGKDRQLPGAPLHTDFKLDTAGEYLALVAPDNTTIVSEFAPAYRAQFANISFGRTAAASVTLLPPEALARVLVPTDDAAGATWRQRDFDDSAWLNGPGGVGYETSPADYAGLLGTDVRAAMFNQNGSCFARYAFSVDDPAALAGLRLVAQYDDGFIAWLNGTEIARRAAPEPLAWNSLATADHPDGLAVVPEEIDLGTLSGVLLPGVNVLAVQILNVRLDSSDLLFRASLEASHLSGNTADAYFTRPTPGSANLGGVAALGPLLDEVSHQPASPSATNDVMIKARATPTVAPVASVSLVYRVMYGPESTLPMLDDGRHDDGAAGDGVFGAAIPAGTAAPGQMVRYRVVAADTEAREARLPLFFDPIDSEEYFGTVVQDDSIDSALPRVHLFIKNVGASENFSGTRASLEFLGEFYDNLGIRLHGQSSSGFPKKSFNLDFNRDHRFLYATNRARVKDIKLMTNYGDKSRLHNSLAYELIRESGSVGHFAFPVRVQRNGTFHGILDLMEDADERFLERAGLNAEGALYKAYDALESAGGSEKKTRREEGTEDLQALISGLAPGKPIAQRVTYAYDNLDLPQIVSYFVGLALVSSQDHGHKNFFAYRDTTGSGDWSLLPWDVDLTFGRNWTDSGGYFTDTLYTNNVLNFYNSAQQGKPANRLYSVIFQNPDFRGMYLRRLRTEMDELLQPPGTPAGELRIEARIHELLDLLDPPNVATSDADLDEARWGSWGTKRNTRTEAQRILNAYLPGRRNWLFNSASATVSREPIPAGQPANARVAIDELDFKPNSGGQAAEYVRLTNAEPYAVDVSGWQLLGEVRHTLRPGTVIPTGHTLHIARDVAGFRNRTTSPKRGENAFVQGNYDGQLSARGGQVELVDTAGRVVSTLIYAGDPTSMQCQFRLSELMFHPAPPPAGSPFDPEDFEFLEFKNIGTTPLDLNGARFTKGIVFAFTNAATSTLAPGARLLLVRNQAAFTARYGVALPVAGEFGGNLANDGDTLRLEDAVGEVVFEFHYDDTWSPLADGQGSSLEPVGPEVDLEIPASWRASKSPGGSPGRTDWPPVVESCRLEADMLIVRYWAEAGAHYTIEASPALSPATWQAYGETAAQSQDALTEISAPAPATVATRFFRLHFQPPL